MHQFDSQQINNQSKKLNTFEPTLLIFEGNDVVSNTQERRPQSSQMLNELQQSQQRIQSDQSDLFFLNNNLVSQAFMHSEMPLSMNENNEAGFLLGKKTQSSNQLSSNAAAFVSSSKQSNAPQHQAASSSKKLQSKNQSNIKQENSGTNLANNSSKVLHHSQSFPLIIDEGFNFGTNGLLPPNDSMNSLGGQLSNLGGHNLSGQNLNNLSISNIKGHVKNTYIKKISSLITVQNQSSGDLAGQDKGGSVKQENQLSDDEEGDDLSGVFNDNKKPGDDQQENKRLKKNRESAKNSRHRKKIYIDLLEKKVSTLNKEIEEVSQFIEKSQSEISSILSTNPLLKGLVSERQAYLEKISNTMSSDSNNLSKQNEDDLTMICDSFRLRLGATGHIRQHTINLFFKHMYKSLLEGNYPYFLYGYQQNQDSEDEEFNRCVEIFKGIIGLPDNDNKIYVALPIIKKLLEHRKSFRKTLFEMKNLQKEWTIKTNEVENLIDKLSPILNSTQVATLIQFIDKQRQQPELSWMKRRFVPIINPAQKNDSSVKNNNQTAPPQISIFPQNINGTTTRPAGVPFNRGPNYANAMTPSQIMNVNNGLARNYSGVGLGPVPPSSTASSSNFMDPSISNLGVNMNAEPSDQASDFYTQMQFQAPRIYSQFIQIPAQHQSQKPNEPMQPMQQIQQQQNNNQYLDLGHHHQPIQKNPIQLTNFQRMPDNQVYNYGNPSNQTQASQFLDMTQQNSFQPFKEDRFQFNKNTQILQPQQNIQQLDEQSFYMLDATQKKRKIN